MLWYLQKAWMAGCTSDKSISNERASVKGIGGPFVMVEGILHGEKS